MADRRNPNTRLRMLAALCTLVAALLIVAAPAAAGSSSARVGKPAGDVRDYWSQARMRAAEPIDPPTTVLDDSTGGIERTPRPAAASYVPAAGEGGGARILTGSPVDGGPRVLPGETRDEILDPSAVEFRSHGKVFFTIATGEQVGDYVCSGTAVNSRNRSVVWTAGHCVLPDGGTEYASNWTFIPAYDEGVAGESLAPFGEWPAKRLATTGPWQESTNLKYDLGAAVVRRSPTGATLQGVVGARGIGFDQPRNQIYRAYGYPAVQPPLEFTGEREFRCTSPPVGTDDPGTAGPATMLIDCDMTAGSSGGGWIAEKMLLSVTSYGYPLDLAHLYGPYMSASARALYRSVRGGPKRKKAGSKGSKGAKGSKSPRAAGIDWSSPAR